MQTSLMAATHAGTPDLLVIDAQAERYKTVLGSMFRVVTTSTITAALQQMTRAVPAALVVELDGADGVPLDLIGRARALSEPPSVLVLTAEPARVPDAMLAGCESVLLRPFAPNLIYARLSRMLRLRHHGRGDRLNAGCMQQWPTMHCANCDHEGVTSFEHASHRRAWYACLACKNVWMAKRRD